MQVRFADKRLERLERDLGFTAGFGRDLVRAFRKRMQLIRSAGNENDFRALKSLHFEKLKGTRSPLYVMRLNDQMRLILEFERNGDGKVVVIVKVVDYH